MNSSLDLINPSIIASTLREYLRSLRGNPNSIVNFTNGGNGQQSQSCSALDQLLPEKPSIESAKDYVEFGKTLAKKHLEDSRARFPKSTCILTSDASGTEAYDYEPIAFKNDQGSHLFKNFIYSFFELLAMRKTFASASNLSGEDSVVQGLDKYLKRLIDIAKGVISELVPQDLLASTSQSS